jgi:hypothetical protein
MTPTGISDWSEYKAYVRLTPVNKERPEVGDIVKLFNKDSDDTALGRVVSTDGWYVQLNNAEEPFSLVDWNFQVLHSEVDTE